MKSVVLILVVACVASAHAQSYTIQEPGKLPVYVRSTSGGGVSIDKAGQLSTTVTPSSRGGATISTPGQLPTYVRTTSGGGVTINKSGQFSTTVTPTSGGGATINTPGQMPIYVRRGSGGSYTVDRPGQPSIYISPSSRSATGTATQVAAYLYPLYQETNTTHRAGKR